MKPTFTIDEMGILLDALRTYRAVTGEEDRAVTALVAKLAALSGRSQDYQQGFDDGFRSIHFCRPTSPDYQEGLDHGVALRQELEARR